MQETSLKCGWLSPTGDFYPCRSYEHQSKAEELCNAYRYNGWLVNGKSYDDILLHNGWVRISLNMLRKKEWCIYWEGFLSEYQKNFLQQYFKDTIPVSNGTNVLWSKEFYYENYLQEELDF